MKLRIYLKSGSFLDTVVSEEQRSFRQVAAHVTAIGGYVNDGVWVPRENIALIMDTSNGVSTIDTSPMETRN